MEKLLLNINGGRPFLTDDLITQQDNLINLIDSILQGININNSSIYILYGIEATVNNPGSATPTVDISPGALYFQNEVFFFDEVIGQAIPNGYTQYSFEENYYWDLSEVESDTRTFKDSTSHNTLVTRKAILTETPTTWSTASYRNTDNINVILKNEDKEVTTVTPESQLAKNTNGSVGTTNDAFLDVTNSNMNDYTKGVIRGLEGWVEITIPSGLQYPLLNIAFSFTSAFSLPRPTTLHPIMIKVNGVPEMGYYETFSNTGDTLKVFRSNGSNFNSSDVVLVYFSEVSAVF